jgi:NTP pyrophosphohydrolases including oxidative damage repair enzymes
LKPIRNSAKAIIIQDGKLLCTKNKDDCGVFYLLPGGGQEPQENLHDTLKRECMEEISAEVAIGDIKYIREYIGKNHEFSQWDYDVHQIEYMFECKIKSNSALQSGSIPDTMQIGVEWIELKDIKELRIYPGILRELISPEGKLQGQVYLGDVN